MGQWVGPGQIIKNQINLDLIEIIQFCLKIYDLLTHPTYVSQLRAGGPVIPGLTPSGQG